MTIASLDLSRFWLAVKVHCWEASLYLRAAEDGPTRSRHLLILIEDQPDAPSGGSGRYPRTRQK